MTLSKIISIPLSTFNIPHFKKVLSFLRNLKSERTFYVYNLSDQPGLITLRRTPAATAEPITPATFGPIACIRRKLPGFSS